MNKTEVGEPIIPKIAGLAGMAGGVIALAGGITGHLASPATRWCASLIAMAMLIYASYAKGNRTSSLLSADGAPVSRRKWNRNWLAALTLVGLVTVIDVICHAAGYLMIGEVFSYEERFTPSAVVRESLALIEKGTGKAVTCSTIYAEPAPLVGPLVQLAFASHEPSQRDLAQDDVRRYYDQHDFDLSFDLRKGPRVDSLVVEDVRVIIDDYKPLPKMICENGGAGAEPTSDRILVYCLDGVDCEDLPKAISPSWYLPDVSDRPVLRWGKATRPRLATNDPMSFHVQFVASKPGAYRMRVEAVVRVPFSKQQVLAVVDEPRWVTFVEVAMVRKIDDALLERYGYERLESGVPSVRGTDVIPIPSNHLRRSGGRIDSGVNDLNESP